MTADAIASVSDASGCQLCRRLHHRRRSKMGKGTMVYVSGPEAARLQALEAFNIPVKILGPRINQASAFKVVYAGIHQRFAGTFCELLMGARKFGMLKEIRAQYEESFQVCWTKFVKYRRSANSRRAACRGDGRTETHVQLRTV